MLYGDPDDFDDERNELLNKIHILEQKNEDLVEDIKKLKAQCKKWEDKYRCFKELSNLTVEYISTLYGLFPECKEMLQRETRGWFPTFLLENWTNKRDTITNWIKDWDNYKQEHTLRI